MIRTKFWRRLYNQDLKNATKMFYEAEKSFDSFLLRERSEEYELSQSKTKIEEKRKQPRTQHHPLQGSSDKQLELLNTLMEKMTAMDKKVNRLENSVGRGRGSYDRGKGRGRSRGRGYDYGQIGTQTGKGQKQVGQQNQTQELQQGIEEENDH